MLDYMLRSLYVRLYIIRVYLELLQVNLKKINMFLGK